MLANVKIQPQLIGNPYGHAVQPFKRFGQARFKAAADVAEMFNRQPRHSARRIDQGPVQGTAL
jgi:hypothetical protein